MRPVATLPMGEDDSGCVFICANNNSNGNDEDDNNVIYGSLILFWELF